MNNLDIISIIIAILALITTVLGWSVTYKQQRKILEKQINANIEKERVTAFISYNLSEIKIIRQWLKTGIELMRLMEKDNTQQNKDEILSRRENWSLEYDAEIMHIVDPLEKRIKLPYPFEYGSLDELLQGFGNIIHEKADSLKKGTEFHSDTDYRIDWGFYAYDLLEALTNEVLGKS